MATIRMAYSPAELVPLLGLSRWSVYKLIKEGKLPSMRLNGRIIVPRKALEQFINEGARATCQH
jgi:excisionase family DNA binding protein